MYKKLGTTVSKYLGKQIGIELPWLKQHICTRVPIKHKFAFSIIPQCHKCKCCPSIWVKATTSCFHPILLQHLHQHVTKFIIPNLQPPAAMDGLDSVLYCKMLSRKFITSLSNNFYASITSHPSPIFYIH